MTTIRKTPQSAPSVSNTRTSESKPATGTTATKPTNEARGLASGVSSFTSARTSPVALRTPASPEVLALKNTAPADASATGGSTPERRVSTDFLNLRTAPTTVGNTPTAIIPPGAELQVTPDETGATRKDGFVHVSWNDGTTQRGGWVSEQYTRASSAPRPRTETDAQAMERAQGLYVNQFTAETQVSGDGRNANCGPTSVVMALRDQGLTLPDIPGVPNNGTDGADVQAARFHMYNGADSARDGVVPVDPNNPDAGYQYAPMSGEGNENSTYTEFGGVQRAVEAAGGVAESISADSASVAQAVSEGKAVVISGNFVEVPPEGGPAREKTDTWARGGGAEEHLVTVTGVTSEGNFIVCDPAHPDKGPIEVTPAELDAFMRGNAGAMSVDGTP
ncbi:MAG TPA: SH3 domain-containing protein [Archangium sp.]|uniref:SH3 domain-containing protein n=1 Tax=Archangium sp. TaxID=1872627 RepID=UPI002E35054A|nr:SH3 domain-containing protein [Archangium sp.]HEX5749148.1 SH3 domain-containing protein [Archangium sp.]